MGEGGDRHAISATELSKTHTPIATPSSPAIAPLTPCYSILQRATAATTADSVGLPRSNQADSITTNATTTATTTATSTTATAILFCSAADRAGRRAAIQDVTHYAQKQAPKLHTTNEGARQFNLSKRDGTTEDCFARRCRHFDVTSVPISS